MLRKVVEDTKKYWRFAVVSGKSELKSEIANSHLSWMWWVLDPLLFMLVYTFVSTIVFNQKIQYFPVFVFVGLSCWNFFNKTIKQSVKVVTKNKKIIAKVYMPKFILVLVQMYVNGFKMMISFALVVIMMVIYHVPLSIHILEAIPMMFVLLLLTFAGSTILLHFGVYVEDLNNLVDVFLRLVFYLSGVFYAISGRLHGPHASLYEFILLKVNPISFIMDNMRNCMLYDTGIDWITLGIWFVISLVISIVGLRMIYKYENSYVKII